MRLNIRLNGYVYRQHLYTVRYWNGSNTTLHWKFSHKDSFKNACSPRKNSRSLKSEDKDKDKDLQISLRGSSRTKTFLEDNNTAYQSIKLP